MNFDEMTTAALIALAQDQVRPEAEGARAELRHRLVFERKIYGGRS